MPVPASTSRPAPRPVKGVGVVTHGGREEARVAALQAARLLAARGLPVVGVAEDWAPPTSGDPASATSVPAGDELELRSRQDFCAGIDVIVVFGGDGTFLRAAYLARDAGIPLIGVNLGRLGFLSELEAAELPDALGRLAAGEFDVEERMTLSVEVHAADGRVAGRSWALNEASVERVNPQRLVVLEVRVGETLFANVPADALICATPTGSTAYAFSARGPILSPLVHAILLVPVAPHSLFDRTLVVDPREALTLRALDHANPCVVSLDGRETIGVPPGGRVRVTRGDAPVRMARLHEFDFYGRVRRKFHLQ